MRLSLAPLTPLLVALLLAPLTAQQATGRASLVVVLPGTTVFHEPACPLVKGAASPSVMIREKAELQHLTPHDCQAAIAAATRTGARGQLVWVDLTTKRYHLAGCSLVGLPRAQMGLDQAVAKYKPCNKCKPPAAVK